MPAESEKGRERSLSGALNAQGERKRKGAVIKRGSKCPRRAKKEGSGH